ncbi:rhodanese-like domain-containing protein [Saccharopolyspora sp. CA-218241]|uniref:rhodanese-like domain-containing protein n=1 Tax=Saccharopolyspora sp. CA-218241 TaxID=3240027 RepID=UPI003D996411
MTSTVDTSRLKELLRTRPTTRLIDVRTPGEFAAAHIPGSHNVPLEVLRESGPTLRAEHSDPVVLVCASGARAEQADALLAESGLTDRRVLGGGVTAWEGDGAPLEQGTGTWAMERQVRLVAGSLVLTGVLGSVFVPKLKWLAAAIGGGLTFAALSNTCAMAALLGKLPHNRGPRQDPAVQLRALTAAEAPLGS